MSTPDHRTAPGSSYFVTTRCAQRRNTFQIPEIAQILIAAMLHYRDSKAYLLHEFVVMPNHLHVLLTPGQTTSLEKAVQLIKGGSSFQISKQRGHKMEIWQQGFHDWTIRDLDDWQAKARYIRMNPVRAQLADKLEIGYFPRPPENSLSIRRLRNIGSQLQRLKPQPHQPQRRG